MSSNNSNDLHPLLRPLHDKLIAQCLAEGMEIKTIFTYRSPAEQDILYAQGRTAPGHKVTNLKGAASKHCFTMPGTGVHASKAFDIAIYDKGHYVGNGDDPRYLRAGVIGESLGLEWGGRWKDPHDPSHFQIA